MAGSLMARALGVLELLAQQARGMPLQEIVDQLGMPKSGAHRLMAELIQLHYVVQDQENLRYLLTTRLMSLGFRQLGNSGILEVAQPALNRLAALSGEMVRLAVVDQGKLLFVAKAQGARAVGKATRLMSMMIDYFSGRKQFGKPIGDFQMVQQMLADSAIEINAARWLLLEAASEIDHGRDPREKISMVKVYAAETMNVSRICASIALPACPAECSC